MRGPATVPSLVTCPTSSTGTWCSFATAMSAAATSRTWLTPPGAPSTSPDAIVCTESTTSRSGDVAATWPSTVARSVSAASSSVGASAPMRSARNRTCPADSSPVTYSTVRPSRPSAPRAYVEATSSSRVDLPTPGSPASSTTAPGTSPPPSTRSSSSTRVGAACAASTSISAMGRAGVRAGLAATVRGPADAGPSSVTVPHAWHSPQRPTHLGVVHPHSVQR